jgi:predicted PurR-regulated permease PerM
LLFKSSFAPYLNQVITAEQKFRYELLTIIVLFLILSTVFIIYFPLIAAITLTLTLAIVQQPLHQKLCERLSSLFMKVSVPSTGRSTNAHAAE